MEIEIVVAIISAGAAILTAIIAGMFTLIKKKPKSEKLQKIQGNGNIQAGKNVNISGGVTVNDETNNRRKP